MNQYDVRLKVRQDTEENWVLNDPILSLGELAISYSLVDSDYTVESLKIGKGKKWSETDIYKSNSEIETYIFNKIGDTDTINMYYDTNDGLYKLDFVGTLSYNDLSNKPTLFSGSYSDLSNKPALFSGSYTDLSNKPTIPAAQVNSDWNSSSGVSQILNKPTIPTTTDGITEGTNKFWTNARTIASTLTSYTKGSNTAILATHTVLQALGILEKKADDNSTKVDTGNQYSVYMEVNPDFSTSRSTYIEGIVYGTGCSERKISSDADTTHLGTITYDYRVSTTATWTLGVSFSTLQSALNNSSDATRIMEIRTNMTGSVAGAVCLTIRRYV